MLPGRRDGNGWASDGYAAAGRRMAVQGLAAAAAASARAGAITRLMKSG
jgi:hypothetical protein